MNVFQLLIFAGKLAEALFSGFGHSKEFIKSAVDALKGKTGHEPYINLQSNVEATYQIASCGYEYGTSWGTKVSCYVPKCTKADLENFFSPMYSWSYSFLLWQQESTKDKINSTSDDKEYSKNDLPRKKTLSPYYLT